MTPFFLTDVDGTLVKTGQEVSSKVIEAARRFTEAGGRFSIVTGRSFGAAEAIIEKLPVNAPCILYGGALVYDPRSRETLRCEYLDESAVPLIREILADQPAVSVTVYTPDAAYNIRTNDRLLNRGVFEDRTAPRRSLDDVDGDRLIKILFTCDDVGVLDGIGESKAVKEKFEYHAASRHFYELTAKGVSKGEAAKFLCSRLAGGDYRLFAAGDADSDASLGAAAESFFAPATASEKIRSLAEFVFPPPEEGGLSEALDYVTDTRL